LIGVGAADQFTGTSATDDATDIIVDAVAGDNDTLTLTATGAVPTVRTINVENIVVNMNSLAADAVDALNFAGVTELTVTRGDVTVGGATLTGNKVVTVTNLNAANVAAVTAGAATTNVVVTQVTTAGATINANNASGNVTVTGAATINATGAGTGDTVLVNVLGNATQDARAVNVTTGAATVTIGAFTGAVTVDAANATNVSVAGGTGGVTITAGNTVTPGIVVANIDNSGATITAGSGGTTAAPIVITIDDNAVTNSTATISAGGVVTLDVDGAAAGVVDAVTLSGNGAAVTYNLATPAAAITSITKAGSQTVTLAGANTAFSAVTVAGVDVLDINALTAAAAAIDADSWTAGYVDLGVDNANAAITVANAQTWHITADQTTGLDFDFATTTVGDLTVVAGDDNGDNTAVGTITVGAFNAAAGAATTTGTVTIEASIANFTATSTVLGAAQTLSITGDEDVTLGAVTALAVNAANSTGIINMTAAENVATVTTGSGADVLILNDATNGGAVVAHTVSTGAGNDTITVTATAATATIDAGDGNDALTLTATTAYVVSGGAGNDTFTTGADIEAIILGGDGTDTFVVNAGGINFSNNTQFALNSIESINLTATNGTTTISAAQLAANPTFAVTADGDTLQVTSTTAAGSIDASGITIAAGSTAVLSYTGSTGANVMTGGVQNETFQGGAGADSIEGGTGTDTFVLEGVTTETGSANDSIGMVVNLSSSAVTAATIISNVANTFLGGSATTVAAGTATHLYDEVAALNASVVDQLSSIENITGGAGADYIIGSSDNNVLNGAGGADYISGGDGDDTLIGGAGVDTLVGGSGADTFVMDQALNANRNAITDFTIAQGDVLALSRAVFTNMTGAAGSAVTVLSNAAAAALIVANVAGAAANSIVVASAAQIAALDFTAGNGTAAGAMFAIESDTGNLLYDLDGDFGAGVVIVGTVTAAQGALVVAGNMSIIA
jgi:Ca2+-binding RTX toxin-like protein